MKQLTLEQARRWCVEAHGDQMYGDQPYEFHLNAVEQVAIRFGFTDDQTRMKCLGHDVIEDTDKDEIDMLEAGFPGDVVEDIWLVSDAEGATRKERKAKTLAKIRTKQSAIKVKLCDRIANVENGEKVDMYRNEHADFEAALRDFEDKELEPLWLHLEVLLYG